MDVFQVTLIVATFLSSLVAGLLFSFAVVVMPGIKSLNDREFIRAFQVIDRVIQNNQPIFMLVWIGSALVLIASLWLGLKQLDGVEQTLMIVAALIYLFGVQLPTIVINVPLNNKLQTLDVDMVDESAHRSARERFEPRWNRWNLMRTVLSSLASALLIVLLFSI